MTISHCACTQKTTAPAVACVRKPRIQSGVGMIKGQALLATRGFQTEASFSKNQVQGRGMLHTFFRMKVL